MKFGTYINGQWVKNDGMPRDVMKDQGHKNFKVVKSTIFIHHLQRELASKYWFLPNNKTIKMSKIRWASPFHLH